MKNISPAADSQSGFSHKRTLERFDMKSVASQYPSVYGDNFRQQREKRCVIEALKHVPAGGSILDLPCGTGRLAFLMAGAGFQVTGADSSSHMVELARENYRNLRQNNEQLSKVAAEFSVRDVMATGYDDHQFDAVFCNRLFHHFIESETRVKALAELGRICKGPVIVSYFESFAFDSLKRRLRYALKGSKPIDRVAISLRNFTSDLHDAGLEIATTLSVLRGFSPMRYVVAYNKVAATPLRKAS